MSVFVRSFPTPFHTINTLLVAPVVQGTGGPQRRATALHAG